jgi:hypothetical protein
MDSLIRHTLSYHKGYLALTSTHLIVARGGYLAESLALQHLSVIGVEEAHSFRHRILGLLAGLALLAVGTGVCTGDFALLGAFHGRLGIGAVFGVFFGIVFLATVAMSRRIWWLRVRYGGTTKLIPLAGAEQEVAERFMAILSMAVEDRT